MLDDNDLHRSGKLPDDPFEGTAEVPRPQTPPDPNPKTQPPSPYQSGFPVLDPFILYGLAGEIALTIDPHTEADLAATYFQFLAAAGNAMGRNAFTLVEGTRHYPNLFVALVGQSSKARKGTSWARVDQIICEADPDWKPRRQKGLSSGEGLIQAVRDPDDEDSGVADKRLMVVESEFASVLNRMNREGNTLSAILREAWDGGDLQTLTKGTPQRATDAYISLVTHITEPELAKRLSSTDLSNGLANRFLWISVRRSKLLPDGGGVISLSSLISQLRDLLDWVKPVREVRRSEGFRVLWRQNYERLSADHPGVFGQVVSRSEAQVIRLSLLFALLDCSNMMEVAHLTAAMAAMEYAIASARHIFGGIAQPTTDSRILVALQNSHDGLTRAELSRYFSHHLSAMELDEALQSLLDRKLIRWETAETGGRPSTRWFYIGEAAKKAKEAKEGGAQ